MEFKKLPFYLVGCATITSIALSLVGFGLGFYYALVLRASRDMILTGTVLIVTCSGTCLVTTYLLYIIRELYLRVFPKQASAEQESGE